MCRLATRSLTCVALLVAPGCAFFGMGTRVDELGDGRYRISTSNAQDPPTANREAALDQCPYGYDVQKTGLKPDSAFFAFFYGSDYRTYWIIRCRPS